MRYLIKTNTSEEIQTALDEKTLSNPYVALISGSTLDFNSLEPTKPKALVRAADYLNLIDDKYNTATAFATPLGSRLWLPQINAGYPNLGCYYNIQPNIASSGDTYIMATSTLDPEMGEETVEIKYKTPSTSLSNLNFTEYYGYNKYIALPNKLYKRDFVDDAWKFVEVTTNSEKQQIFGYQVFVFELPIDTDYQFYISSKNVNGSNVYQYDEFYNMSTEVLVEVNESDIAEYL